MLERIIVLIMLTAFGYALYRWTMRRNLQRVAQQRDVDPILQELRPGIPAVVYFTTPNCIPCKTQQQPALAKLSTELGENVQIIQIDATQNPDAANRWGVMTAPTTFILSKDGTPKAVNYGVASEIKLKQQLQGAA
jgi:thiol-disulfide isomerase/thioredoxin